MTMLPKRDIHLLRPFPKIIEALLYDGMSDVPDDVADPQMAYRPGRSCTTCNIITLTEVERSNKPSVQAFLDLRKGFNKADRLGMRGGVS